MAVVDLPIGLMYSVVLAGFALMTWRALGVARLNWVGAALRCSSGPSWSICTARRAASAEAR